LTCKAFLGPDLFACPTDLTCYTFLVPDLLAGPMHSTCETFLGPDLFAGPTDLTCEVFEMRSSAQFQWFELQFCNEFYSGQNRKPDLQFGSMELLNLN
jgi:hypothetical protein